MDRETVGYIFSEIKERLSVAKKDIRSKEYDVAIGEVEEVEQHIRRLLAMLYLESEKIVLDK